ncbi:MAG TPA: MBL fold metallo-hydrolase [Candidatus Omnitrophota bacterium]|nr:MBL fold metallo-hydrolase [Candidatus Omnitrophota bacterium]HPS37743.1 MBL fold metallo-hydrolase [Candidatus Omnitrophota bacterium]
MTVAVKVLRSSSSGNATLIWNKQHAILVDCGIGPRVLEGLLQPEGFSIRDLAGVLVTHSHNDHSKTTTIAKFFKHGVPVYCTGGAKDVIARGLVHQEGHRFRTFGAGPFEVGSFSVTPFDVTHDAEGGCVGFCIVSGSGEAAKKISLATDCGAPGKPLAENLLNSHVVLMASNYCSKMIDGPSPVPKYVKEKHIRPFQPSNEQCAGVLTYVAKESAVKPEAVYLLHISKNHNTVRKAVLKSSAALREAGYGKIRILPTYRDASSVATHLS